MRDMISSPPTCPKDAEQLRQQLKTMESKLRCEGDTMTMFERHTLERKISDLQSCLETKADKLQRHRQELQHIKERASLFDENSSDYKILMHSITSLSGHIHRIEQQLGTAEDQHL